MSKIILTLLAVSTFSFLQFASASSQPGDFKFQQISCKDSAGKTYRMVYDKVMEGLVVKITSDGKTRTFDGVFDVTAFDQLVVSLGSDTTGMGQESQIDLQLPATKSGTQTTVGTVFDKYYYALFPVASISCQIQYGK